MTKTDPPPITAWPKLLPAKGQRSIPDAIIFLGISLLVGTIAGLLGHGALPTTLVALSVVLICAPTLWVARRRLRRRLSDFGAVYLLIFAVYYASVNAEVVAAFATSSIPHLRGYPTQFAPKTYVQAAGVSALGAILLALVLAMDIGGSKKRTKTISMAVVRRLSSRDFLFSGYGTAAIGFGLLIANLRSAGGLIPALQSSRGVRLDNLAATTVWPDWAFVITGLTAVFSHLIHTKKRNIRRWLPWAFLAALWISINLGLGERGHILYLICTHFAVGLSLRPDWVRERSLAIVVFLVALFVGFAFLAHFRASIPQMIRGETSHQVALESFQERTSGWEWLRPSSSEFAAPYFTLLFEIEHGPVIDVSPPSYLNSVPSLVPTAIWSEKPVTPGRQFSEHVHSRFKHRMSRAVGWGYSPLAEAIANFGWLGVPVTMAFLGIVALGVSRLSQTSNPFLWLAYMVAFTQTVNFNRSELSLQEPIKLAVAVAIAGALSATIRRVLRSAELLNQDPPSTGYSRSSG